MRLLNLFDGIGGFALAARWMGWENVASCEIDPFCRRVLDYHFNYRYIYMRILNKQISPRCGVQLTLLQEDSPASLSPSQVIERGRKMTATSSQRCFEQYARFPRVGSWQRTFTALFLNREGWFSSRCALQWRLSATRFNRLLCRLVPSTLPIDAIGCGLLPTVQTQSMLPTPHASDASRGGQQVDGMYKTRKSGQTYMSNLNDLLLSGLLPTPNAAEGTKYATTYNPKSQMGRGLTALAMSGLIPTPRAMDFKEGTAKPAKTEIVDKALRLRSLNHNISRRIGKNSRLNPRFVAEMMGFPPDWTASPFLGGESSQ